MAQTVTVIAPDGTPRAIPAEQAQAAIQAGGKQAVRMIDPTGTPRWVSTDQQDAALKAGGKLASAPSNDQGFFSSFGDQNALVQGAKMLGHAVAHPIDTLTALGHTTNPQDPENPLAQQITGMAQNTAQHLQQGYQYGKEGNRAGAILEGGLAIPILGSAMEKATDQYASGNYRGEMGTLTGLASNVITPEKLKAGAKTAATTVKQGLAATGDLAQAIKDRAYPTPKSLPAPEAAARNLGKALVVPTQAMPNFVSAATNEAGTILDYAKRNNVPINSTIDLAKAAKGAADEVQGFYNKNVLEPNANLTVDTGKLDYRGKTTGDQGNRATVSQIDNRINEISQELSPNYRKALAVQTNAANVSDADLLAEKRTLTSTLHRVLADATGVEPQDIASLRQRAGKLRTIADETNLSANTDTTAAGKSQRGRSDIPTGTKLGIVEHGIQMLRGGPEIIGNRAVKGALSDITPTNTPFPDVNNPNFVASRNAQAAANQTAAQQEFLRSQQLEQGAQSEGTLRNMTAQPYRDDFVGRQVNSAKQEFLRSNQLEQGAQDASTSRANTAATVRGGNLTNRVGGQQAWAELGGAKLRDHISRDTGSTLTAKDIDALNSTPQGKSLLIKAGDLSPGSAAMKNLIKDIQIFRSR